MQSHLPIRVATIGHDSATARLVEAVERDRRFEWVARFDWDESEPAAARHASTLPTDPPSTGQRDRHRWEALLSDGLADLVIVASRPDGAETSDRRAEQLRRIIQVGLPLILVHPVCDMLLAYELDMHRRDANGPIYPYCPTANHPLISAWSAAIHSNTAPCGSVEQIVCERSVAADQRDKRHVLKCVARDALVVQRLLGDISSVSATGVSADGLQWGNLGIHFTSSTHLMARWSFGSRQDTAGLRLTIVGNRSTATAWLPDAEGSAEVSPTLDGFADNVLSGQSPDDFLDRVADAAANDTAWKGTSWDETCRSLEVTDAVERSVARRRTIELYHEQVTEQETFKSMMAAGGCGMLLWVLSCLLMVGLVEGLQVPIRHTALWQLWPLLMLAPLAAFLALQLLQLVFRNGSKRSTEGGEPLSKRRDA